MKKDGIEKKLLSTIYFHIMQLNFMYENEDPEQEPLNSVNIETTGQNVKKMCRLSQTHLQNMKFLDLVVQTRESVIP